jgi:sterol desaturase/sphingolipid hydroxylase (fatty acid hydroxylase superfamily)
MSFGLQTIIFFVSAVVYTLVEFFYSVMKKDGRYKDDETQSALYNGMVLVGTETVSVLLFISLTTKLYKFLFGNIPSTNFLQIIGTVLVIDFLYYLYHRAHHVYAKLYTIHRIHHVGTTYNLSLALLLPWIGQASIYLMFVPLVFLHISPYTIISAYYFLLTYQLFCHTAYMHLPKWCDYFLVTPRNHRIHHYDDRESQMHNFGSVFSVWDRLCGTYLQKEKDGASFGLSGYEGRNIFAMQKETVMQFLQR